ncbi:MAG: response regulator [Betaproteobacteria bacterium]|nr:response regulator [Betaproteobacteria bacterium]
MNAATPANFRLQRYFSIASGILMLGVVLPLAYAYYYSEMNEHTMLAGVRNEVLARIYANTLWPRYGEFLLRTDIDAETRKTHEINKALDLRIREMSRDASVTKIKVYNLNGIAVYSSVLREIGENKSKNSGFIAASQGRLVNELAHRGTMSATEGEIQNVDVVSTYIPIKLHEQGNVVAVFELYSNVTANVHRIEIVTYQLLFGLVVVFLVLYLSLLRIVAHADRIIQRQYLALKDNESRLQSKTQQLEQEIQERLHVERALRQSEELAAAGSQAKTDFLSGMSHELRTPMNAILGFTQLLDTEPDAPLNESQRRFVKQIMKAGAHLLALIDQALDLSRIEAGKLALSLERVGLKSLIDETLPMVHHLAAQRQIAPITVSVADAEVIADYGRLKQVLLNLLSNAVKYNRVGGSISVTATPDGEMMRIAVTDTGQGIPQQRLEELFQPFNRLGVESASVEGTGIGLALSKRLVEAMGGAIGVETTEGIGSSFWITLPVAPPESSEATDHPAALAISASSQAIEEDPGTGIHGRDRKILYVEDNPANVTLMEELIRRFNNLRLVTAHTAEIGLALAEQERPDLIIMDINLPGIDGFEALAKLQANPKTASIPVMALTANAMPSAIERGLAAGFHSYHTKPIQIDALTRSISQALEETDHGGI